jgi:hypothetical protein
VAKKGTELGYCRLCGAYGPLEESHIVPKAAYRRILDGPDGEALERQPVKVTAAASVRTNKQVCEHLLCPICEDRFADWESYSFPVLSQGDRTFPWLASARRYIGPVSDCVRVDAAKLSLFATSIFWRLSVSREFGDRYGLGRYESDVRRYLLVDGARFPDHARLAINLLDPTGATWGRVDRTFATFGHSREGACRVHRFVLLGVDMRLFVGAHIPHGLEEICFARTGRAMIRSANAFARRLGPTLAKSPPRALLARS